MRWFVASMRVVGWLVIACLGVCGLVGFFRPGVYGAMAKWMAESPHSVIGGFVGAGLVILDLLWLWGVYAACRKDHIEFETSRGRILVGLGALQDALARTLMDEASVRDASVEILNAQKAGRPLRIYAQVGIYERGDLVNLQKHLQELLEERFRDMLVIEREVRYDVELVRIRPKSPKDGAEEEMFHGPQYPVDG